jgi:hypothetical protein
MQERPRIVALVLNWNGAEHTVRCLDSLRNVDYPSMRTLVIDNGSTDGSPGRIHAAHPGVELIETGENLGYAGGNNLGIRRALDGGADYVWVLNNDVVVEPSSLDELIAAARATPGAGIIGSSVWAAAGGQTPQVELAAYRWRGEYRLPSPCPESGLHEIDDIAGASALLSAAMLRETGGFEERFFHYWEDVEFCARARQHGWSTIHACRSRVWHVVGGSLSTSSAQAHYYFVRNWLLFSRWSGRGGLVRLFLRAPRMVGGLLLGVRWLRRRRWLVPLAGFLGVFDAMRGRSGRRELPGWLR